MKVAVVGGSGFLGRHVVEALRARGHEAVVLARGRRSATEGTAVVRWDPARTAAPAGALAGCDAVVNLAGVKREAGGQTFEGVHVEAVRRIVDACRAAGIRRLVHVSVAGCAPDPRRPYDDTKWRGEQVVRESGLDFTILKPAVVYGPGDDMVTHLVKMIRCAPVFPVVGRGDSVLQPVDARDVAEAAVAALTRPRSIGRSYDLVGPDRMTLRQVVRTVADGLGLRLWFLPTPVAVMRPAVRLMEAVAPAPLSTPAQLELLVRGLYGDDAPARRDLNVAPRAFTPEAVRALAPSIGPLLGVSVRLDAGAPARPRLAAAAPRALALAGFALVLQVVLAAAVPNVWYRMLAAGALLSAAALATVDVGWRELYRFRPRHLASGAAAAAVLYVLGAAMTRLLLAVPAMAAQVAEVYGWASAVPERLALPLLVAIVAGEEIVWRNAVTLPLAARLGPWTGTLAAAALFGLAHLPLGVPLLLVAALGAGGFWSAMVVQTRSAVPALVCHLLWDLAVLFWWPYTGWLVGTP